MKYDYESTFAPYINGLIVQKRADGFKYDSEEWIFKKFDDFCKAHFPDNIVISYELVAEWSAHNSEVNKSTRRRRLVIVKQLCLYMLSLGLEAYIPRYMGRDKKPVLYIPSHDEMMLFFNELDSWEKRLNYGLHFLGKYQILFRLYYCCGLRLSEACLMTRKNVDLKKGTLTVLQSKGRKDRLVYLPSDGITMMAEYLRNLNRELPDSPWLFPGDVPGAHISAATVQRRFTKCWNKLPFAKNTDKQPSLHCLRHSFVVERMNDWMKRGIDLQKMLSHLSAYLGHASPSETFYYYHLVDKAFDIIKQKDKTSGRVIPGVMPYEEI